ncbi:putative gamma-glutamylcyclotransferase CG2811 isoform X1 [Lutzomyia longipalpis]|uniref:putative gamma-glutamylcyclotransferase CG2811 isoform X1 n=1 Tax=Lutzomyia longipalpis TaxID=7200 RepID=UPI0024834D8D|nr:putative gamma-glutamylcyclotransferase CG2811 isoform X1 [Lutzomyia longipalpis]XP_055690790.1 putative gamma-glutamylcyclotransferase CG2811 isoform X1 [Lutzomyia longipalpis]
MSSSALRRFFVYGTLKRGEPNHKLLTSPENGVGKFVGRGETTIKFPLVIGTRYNIPFLLNKRNTGNFVRGEIYEVDDTMVGKLDELEGYPDFYDREIQDIKLLDEGEEKILSCWVYLLRTFPDHLLNFEMLTEYRDTPERKYCEVYNESTPDDLRDHVQADLQK